MQQGIDTTHFVVLVLDTQPSITTAIHACHMQVFLLLLVDPTHFVVLVLDSQPSTTTAIHVFFLLCKLGNHNLSLHSASMKLQCILQAMYIL